MVATACDVSNSSLSSLFENERGRSLITLVYFFYIIIHVLVLQMAHPALVTQKWSRSGPGNVHPLQFSVPILVVVLLTFVTTMVYAAGKHWKTS